MAETTQLSTLSLMLRSQDIGPDLNLKDTFKRGSASLLLVTSTPSPHLDASSRQSILT